jgi:RNA polymerase sigma-70 factor (ECF subfamily)
MDLGTELLSRVPEDVARALAPLDGLDAILRAHLDAARAASKDVHVEDADFVAHVARSLPAEDPRGALASLHAADLYLALACGRGDARAIAELERKFMSAVPDALTRMAGKVQPDDVVQTLRAKLLVSDGERRILGYSGRGPLGGWIRVAALRIALDMIRSAAGEPAPRRREALLDVTAAIDNPELEHLRARHTADFKAAFEEALTGLTGEERNVLRLYLVDGLSIDEIGTIFQVHRATAARWIARSRDRVHHETRRILAERLRVSDTEMNSLFGILRSQLDLSICRMLNVSDDGGAPRRSE